MKHIMTTDPAVAPAQARALLRQWDLATPRTPRVGAGAGGPPAALAGAPAGSSPAGVVLDLARAGSGELEARAWADDRAFLAWADGGGGASVIAAELKARGSRICPLAQLASHLRAQGCCGGSVCTRARLRRVERVVRRGRGCARRRRAARWPA